ncbi:bromodomain-containing factor 2 [Capsicum galapagoense]
MKRRRGSKKGKAKKPRITGTTEGASNNGSMNTETSSGTEEIDNDGVNSGVEAETPSSTGTDQPEKPVMASPGVPRDKPAGLAVYGRMKVKIKTSKTVDAPLTSPEVATHSDTDKSSQQAGPEKQVLSNEKMEDSANSVPEANVTTPGNVLKKCGGIKIKSSSKGFSSSMSPVSNAEMVKEEKTTKQEPELLHRDVRLNKQELNIALEVIRKIMKMEAAEPFNTPVDPIALGIPDYFDVIDTPMDFGTICRNLESGVKYMNSEDVYKDVQYIWNNCYKYNNKGDYVMDLMKRVKKNFAKYWTAAGLYSDHLQSAESSQVKDTTPSSNGKEPTKSGSLTQKSNKRFQGLKKHKEGCLCAICVMIRRRQEREEINRLLDDQVEASDDSPDDLKPEETSPVESREYTSSNMENSPEQDVVTIMQEKGAEKLGEGMGNEMGIQSKRTGIMSEHLQSGYASVDERKANNQKQNVEPGLLNDNRKENLQHGNENAATGQQRPKEVLDKYRKAKMLENLRYLENPTVMELSRILFADDQRSVWNGPHSLVKRGGSTRKSSIHAAVSLLMQ